MTIRKTQIQAIRTNLEKRRADLALGLKQATNKFLSESETHHDSLDQASADIDRTFEMRLKNRESMLVKEIDEVLKRIDGGEFGLCENCGEEIHAARLSANPLTSLCITCKAEIESEQNRFQSRAFM